jgi:hypothetical protein
VYSKVLYERKEEWLEKREIDLAHAMQCIAMQVIPLTS